MHIARLAVVAVVKSIALVFPGKFAGNVVFPVSDSCREISKRIGVEKLQNLT